MKGSLNGGVMAKTEEPGERWKEEREREAKSGELKATKD